MPIPVGAKRAPPLTDPVRTSNAVGISGVRAFFLGSLPATVLRPSAMLRELASLRISLLKEAKE